MRSRGGAAITMPRPTAGSKARPEGNSSLRIWEAWGSTGNKGGQSTYLGPCQPWGRPRLNKDLWKVLSFEIGKIKCKG